MHTIDIIINTFIVLIATQVWTIIGYLVLTCLEDYETTESELLSCFFWFVIILSWLNIKVNEAVDNLFEDKP